ncbi:unnamed protein product [Pleuronectes platessa]|uniref:Uncharacterized protein n=1 Tax=Pleuronectes platessa TaxID=8262 RepID=A0A9N7TK91_PLEPL|nr:unnamed protein product [Pleuronectes platessa]
MIPPYGEEKASAHSAALTCSSSSSSTDETVTRKFLPRLAIQDDSVLEHITRKQHRPSADRPASQLGVHLQGTRVAGKRTVFCESHSPPLTACFEDFHSSFSCPLATHPAVLTAQPPLALSCAAPSTPPAIACQNPHLPNKSSLYHLCLCFCT